jgi:glycine/sarcosine N-methyltransferase
MIPDPYEGFARRYDLFGGGFGRHDPKFAAFFRKLFDLHHIHSVLDCACGTGNDVYLFHTLGREVHGADISDAMLAQAAKNLAKAGVNIPFQKADYRELPRTFRQSFDAVVCLSSSIHRPDEPEVLRAFKSMHAILRDEGILVLTQGTTDKQWKEKPRFILAVNDPHWTRLFVIDYLGRGARYNILDITRDEADGGLEFWSVDYPQMLLKDDHGRLLTVAGFTRVASYETYDFEPYDRGTSNRLIVVAQK